MGLPTIATLLKFKLTGLLINGLQIGEVDLHDRGRMEIRASLRVYG